MAPEEIELDITDVAHGGVFVGRHEDAGAERGGRVVFVSDALPGERVRVRLTDTGKSSFWRGTATEVLTASPHRRPHVWRQAGIDVPPELRPGGADFGHIALDHQRELKTQVIRDALRRVGGLDLPVTVEPARPLRGADGEVVATESDDGTGWRTRVSLHVDADGRVGPYAPRSHRVIPVDDLPLATEAIALAGTGLRDARPGRLDLVQPADGRVRVIARADAPARGRRGPRGPRRGGSVAGAPPASGAAAREVVVEEVSGRPFRVDAGGFWQVHRLAAQTLSEAVADVLAAAGPDAVDPDAWHLDLYGGVGLLAAAVAGLGGSGTRITTVESDPRATEHAGENLADWVGARAETGRVDRWLADLEASASAAERTRLERGVVVLDPPRSGAGREVVERLARLRPARIVYVACDPVALARDLSTFHSLGYDAGAVHGYDLFPHSHHIEALVLLTRGVADR